MKLLLCITIGPAIPVSYRNEVAGQIRNQMPEVVIYDCDNHSEALIIRYATDVLNQARQAAVLIQATTSDTAEEPVLGSVRILFEKLLQQSDKALVLFGGQHSIAERMLSLLPAEKCIKNLNADDQVKAIQLFLNNPE
jgi:hypothetical protein